MSSVSDPSMRVIAADHVLVQEIEGQSALLNTKSERYFGLDDVGTRMWQVLTTSESLGVACDTLQAEYRVDAIQLRQDVGQLVNQLVENGLVHLQTPAESK